MCHLRWWANARTLVQTLTKRTSTNKTLNWFIIILSIDIYFCWLCVWCCEIFICSCALLCSVLLYTRWQCTRFHVSISIAIVILFSQLSNHLKMIPLIGNWFYFVVLLPLLLFFARFIKTICTHIYTGVTSLLLLVFATLHLFNFIRFACIDFFGSSSVSLFSVACFKFCFCWIFNLTFCMLSLFSPSSSSACFFLLIKKPTPQPRSSIVRRDEFMRPTVCTLVWSMNSSSGEVISLSVAFAMKHIHIDTRTSESSNHSLAGLLAGRLACLFACAQPKLDHSFIYYIAHSLYRTHCLQLHHRNSLFQSRNYCVFELQTYSHADTYKHTH